MARLKRGIFVMRAMAHENDTTNCDKNPDGSPRGYRHELVDMLNRMRAGSAMEMETAERIGTLVSRLNESAFKCVEFDRWCVPFGDDGPPQDTPDPRIEEWRDITASYRLELELLPPSAADNNKWLLMINCSSADQPHVRSEGDGEYFYPEMLMVEMVVMIALDGQLGTIQRCEVCSSWFLSKSDSRVRCCQDHDVDDLRTGTPERRKQLAAAAKKQREKGKAEDERHLEELRKSGHKVPNRKG